MKNFLAIVTSVYCLGILSCRHIQFNFWIAALFGIILTALAALFKKNELIFLCFLLSASFLAGYLSLHNSLILPKRDIANFHQIKKAGETILDGFMASALEEKGGAFEFILSVRQVQSGNLSWSSCGKVLVRMDFWLPLTYGKNLKIAGVLNQNPGFKGGYNDFLKRQGIYLSMQIKDRRQITLVPGQGGNKLISFCLGLRAKLESVISRYLDEISAGMLNAMVLGERKQISRLVNDYMVKSGTVHILVVSGFNVGIVAFVCNLIFKFMRIRRKLRIILAIICLFVYCLVTGASNPVIRATVMGIIFLFSYFLKKEPDIGASLTAAALLILVIRPGELFDIGFQLSFASVLSIAFLYPQLSRYLGLEKCKPRALKFIFSGCLVSLCAWAGTLFIIAFNFHIVTPIAVLANILVVPLATLITLSGFAMLIAGLCLPFLAQVFSFPVSALIKLLLSVNSAVLKIPFAYFYI